MIARAWAQCRQRAPTLTKQLLSMPAPRSTSSLTIPSGTSVPTPPHPPPPMAPPPPPPLPFSMAVEEARPELALAREQRESGVKGGLVQRLTHIFLAMGPRGLAWDHEASDDVEAQLGLIAARPARLSVPHLRQILLAWDRWVAAKPQGAPLHNPSPTHLGRFLQQEAKKGPTVAASRMRGFRWLHANLGSHSRLDRPC